MKAHENIWEHDIPSLTRPHDHLVWSIVAKRNLSLDTGFDEVLGFIEHCQEMVWRYLGANNLIHKYGEDGFLFYDCIEKSAPWLLDWMEYYSLKDNVFNQSYLYVLKLQDMSHPNKPNLGQLQVNIGLRNRLNHKEYKIFMERLETAIQEIVKEINS